MTPKITNHLTDSQIVEVCDCPPEYNSSSCQDPSLGYFRYYNTSASATIIVQTVGEARQCDCNGRSSICDIDTGSCKVCSCHRLYINTWDIQVWCGRVVRFHYLCKIVQNCNQIILLHVRQFRYTTEQRLCAS